MNITPVSSPNPPSCGSGVSLPLGAVSPVPLWSPDIGRRKPSQRDFLTGVQAVFTEALLTTTIIHPPDFDPALALGRIRGILSTLIQYCMTRVGYLYAGCFTCGLEIRSRGIAGVLPVVPSRKAKAERNFFGYGRSLWKWTVRLGFWSQDRRTPRRLRYAITTGIYFTHPHRHIHLSERLLSLCHIRPDISQLAPFLETTSVCPS